MLACLGSEEDVGGDFGKLMKLRRFGDFDELGEFDGIGEFGER